MLKINYSKLLSIALLSLVLALGIFGTTLYHQPLINPAMAQTNDDTDTATDSAEEEATQNLKKRIERVVQDKKSEIEVTLDSLTNTKRGFIGQVQRLSEEAITIKNPKGTQILGVDASVNITKASKTIQLDDIAVDDWVTVMGYEKDTTFEPKKIIVSSSSLRPNDYSVILGSIKNITSSKIDVSPRSNQETTETNTYTLSKNISYEDLEGTEITRTDLTEDMQILLVGYQDDDDTRVATTIKALTVVDEDDE